MTRRKYALDEVINPRSIAIVGASGTPGKIGYQILRNALEQGYRGRVYPVNPTATEVMGLKAYPSVKDIPESVDLACIIVPNNAVPQVVEECGEKGVKGAIIYAGGFAEIGGKGAELQRKIAETAARYGMRILGPNINGMFNGSASLNVSFNQFSRLDGPASIVSQSGSFASGVVFESIRNGFGFNKFIILGNRADVNEVEALEYLGKDSDTKAIAMYIESLIDEEAFVNIASKVSRSKPIVFLKAGVTEAGVRAIRYTTASEVEGDPRLEEALRRAGVVTVRGGEELVDTLFALINQPAPRGRRVGVVTNSGGIAVIATDRLEELGLEVPALSSETRERLKKIIPGFGSPWNPVDLTGSLTYEMLRDSLMTLIESEEVDILMAVAIRSIFIPLDVFERAFTEAAEAASKRGKPFIVCMMGDDRMFELFSALRGKGIPCYPTPERAATSTAHLYEYSLIRGG